MGERLGIYTSCGMKRRGSTREEKHDWIVERLYHFFTRGDFQLTSEREERGRKIFDAEFQKVVDNLKTAEKIGSDFRLVKPFFDYPEGGEIDLLCIKDYELTGVYCIKGIEVKTNGESNLSAQKRNFLRFIDKEYPGFEAEMYCFNGRGGLRLVRSSDFQYPI